MEKINKENSFFIYNFILSIIMCLVMSLSNVTALASPIEGENIINNCQFLTFTKGEGNEKGKYIYSNVFLPDSVYSDAFTYNAAICPNKFLLDNNITSDYVDKLEENGVHIVKLANMTDEYKTSKGRIYRFGITSIPNSVLDQDIFFVFYVQDESGNKYYLEPNIASFNELTVGDYTFEELAKLANQKVEMNANFKGIVTKLNELMNSFWKYIVMGLASVIVVWGAYVGIKIAIAKKNDEKVNARGMVKNLIIGIVIMFILASGIPLLINGLATWIK